MSCIVPMDICGCGDVVADLIRSPFSHGNMICTPNEAL